MTLKEVNGFAILYETIENLDIPSALSILDPATSKLFSTLPTTSGPLLQNQVGYLLCQ